MLLARSRSASIKPRAIAPYIVDFPRIAGWLGDCGYLHAQVCGDSVHSCCTSIPLRCIDCHIRAIVEINDDDEYIALSYVWGGIASVELEQKTLLPYRCSQVIEDAIVVVLRLGHRFLWVDQYCLDQQDGDIKHTQLNEMDRVYAGAYATIVAAAGSDANHGLPGISRARYEQPRLILDGLELLSSLPILSHAIKDTTWSSRGWLVIACRHLLETRSDLSQDVPGSRPISAMHLLHRILRI
jgi:hypothetical protein